MSRPDRTYEVKDTYHSDYIKVKDGYHPQFRDAKVVDGMIFGSGNTDREAIQNMIDGLKMDAEKFQKWLDLAVSEGIL